MDYEQDLNPIVPYSFMANQIPWNKGLKGFGTFNKGRKRPDLSKRMKAAWLDPEYREKMAILFSERMKGKPSPNKGKKLAYMTERNLKDNPAKRPEVRKKMSETRKRLIAEGKVKVFGHGLEAGHKGKDNGRWIDGRTPFIKTLRQSEKYAEWRTAVFRRDNWTCKVCKMKGGNIHADHIKSFTHFPALRFDVNNGQTLCVSCHAKKTFGTESTRWRDRK